MTASRGAARSVVAALALFAALVLPAGAANHAATPAVPAAKPASAPAPGPLLHPRIAGAGAVRAMPDGTDMPAADGTYRILFDARDDAATPSGVNRHLDAAARAVNLYALAGVPDGRVHVAVVVHSKATPMALSDARYRAHMDKPHPDADLIARLHAAGVEFYVCGQALTHRGYRSDEVHPGVRVTLSALTKLVELQSAGYRLVP